MLSPLTFTLGSLVDERETADPCLFTVFSLTFLVDERFRADPSLFTELEELGRLLARLGSDPDLGDVPDGRVLSEVGGCFDGLGC